MENCFIILYNFVIAINGEKRLKFYFTEQLVVASHAANIENTSVDILVNRVSYCTIISEAPD